MMARGRGLGGCHYSRRHDLDVAKALREDQGHHGGDRSEHIVVFERAHEGAGGDLDEFLIAAGAGAVDLVVHHVGVKVDVIGAPPRRSMMAFPVREATQAIIVGA